MARILVVEDEPRLALAVQRGLQDEQHAVDVERDGQDGLLAAKSGEHDLLVLDLMLPGLSGLVVCRRLRDAGATLPILMLTARDTTEDIVAGLNAGADDYLTKPFAFGELVARVHALLRRATGQPSPCIRIGTLEVDTLAHRVSRDGEEIALTAKEFRLLEALARRPGSVLSQQRLMDALWERDQEPTSNSIEVHVANLRRKVDRNRDRPLIHTIRGVGYVLRPVEP